MKKIIALAMAACVLCTLLCACGKEICSSCGQKKNCSTKEIGGVEVVVCKDCEKNLDAIGAIN